MFADNRLICCVSGCVWGDMATNKLSDVMLRGLKPRDRIYNRSDGDGLVIKVSTTGARSWRLRYRFNGKQKELSLGMYPDVSLARARELRSEARSILASGRDPQLAVKASGAPSFAEVYLRWLAMRSPGLKESTLKRLISRMDLYVLPKLGKWPITDLDAPKILKALQPLIDDGKVETAKRCRLLVSGVFDYAVAAGEVQFNPADRLAAALPTPRVSHQPSVAPDGMPQFLRALREFGRWDEITRMALELYVHSVMRAAAMVSLEWSDFDWDNLLITVPAARMKGKRVTEQSRSDHVIPISAPALEIWQALQDLTGDQRYCFITNRSKGKHLTAGVLNKRVKDLAPGKTAHGLRSTFSTHAYESGLFRDDVIELTLAHKLKGDARMAYNRAKYLPERRTLMEWWSGELVRWQVQ